jgi:hypothetical protein
VGWRRFAPGVGAAAVVAALWFSFGGRTPEPSRAAVESETRSKRDAANAIPLPVASAEATRSAPGGPANAELRGSVASARGADARPSQDFLPEPDPELDEELRWTQEALDASREIGERFAAAGEASPPLPGRDARPVAAARAASVASACSGAGDSCLSTAECCEGFACAGGIAGFATPGRCEAPR